MAFPFREVEDVYDRMGQLLTIDLPGGRKAETARPRRIEITA